MTITTNSTTEVTGASNERYIFFLYLVVPAAFLAGIIAVASTTHAQIGHWVSPSVLRQTMRNVGVPIVVGALCIEVLLYQSNRLDTLLTWLRLTESKPMQQPTVRMSLQVITLVCAFLNGSLLAYYAGVNFDFHTGVRIAEFLALFVMSLVWAEAAQPEPLTSQAADKPANLSQETPLPRSNLEPGTTPVQDPAARTYTFEWQQPHLNMAALAGMQSVKTELQQTLAGFTSYARRGRLHDRNGILLSGPPGNGKTSFALAIAGELKLPLIKLACQDITSVWVNEGPAMVKALFKQARTQPCVLFFDEFDGVGMRRTDDHQSAENRKVVTALLAEIDSARQQHIVVIAATNYLDHLDPALIREGRFDFRIDIPYPDRAARAAILGSLLARFSMPVTDTVVEQVAALWEKRSVAFIESTVKRLRDATSARYRHALSVDDFKQASKEASRRTSAIPSTGEKLSTLTLTAAVRTAANSLLYRLRHWEHIAERGGEPPNGVLLYGPPGTGKTHFVRALARELEDWHVFEINTAEVLQSPKRFLETVELATQHRPAIVFLDEADELLRDRTQSNNITATNEILKAMDGLMGKVPEVVFIAATNNPEAIDAAALRNGRFGEKILMDRLQGADLVNFVHAELASRSAVRFLPEITAKRLADTLVQATPADIQGLLKHAINCTFDETGGMRAVSWPDVEQAWSRLSIAKPFDGIVADCVRCAILVESVDHSDRSLQERPAMNHQHPPSWVLSESHCSENTDRSSQQSSQ
jgi:transitional endoplasmic reticulum ATPase